MSSSSSSSSIFSFDFLIEVAKTTITAGVSTLAIGMVLSYAIKTESCCDSSSENIKKEKKTTSDIDNIIGKKPNELKLVIDMIENPLSYQKIKSSFPGALLFVGPPGTGKTEMARSLANKMNAKFFEICGSEIESKWLGESSQNIQTIFKNARITTTKQLSFSPSSSSSSLSSPFIPKCVVFIDEIETIAPSRESGITNHHNHQVLGTLLTEMTRTKSSKEEILIIGATNHLHMLDAAILRPGRFDNIIDFKLPNFEDRKNILKHYAYKYKIENKPIEIKDGKIKLNSAIDFDDIANKMDGLSGAHIKELCLKASRFAAFEKQLFISHSHFLKAIDIMSTQYKKYEHMYL